MTKNLILVSIISLTLIGCQRTDSPEYRRAMRESQVEYKDRNEYRRAMSANSMTTRTLDDGSQVVIYSINDTTCVRVTDSHRNTTVTCE